MDENPEISQFLRHFVSSGGKPGADADAHVDEKRSGDGQTADEIVHSIGDQDQVGKRPMLAWSPVAVVPVKKLLERQKERESQQNPQVDCRPTAVLLDGGG